MNKIYILFIREENVKIAKEKVRVLRILEYVGDREWVEETLKMGGVPANGTSERFSGRENIIKSAIIDGFPEILSSNDDDSAK